MARAPAPAGAPARTGFHARVLRDGSRLYWWVEVVAIVAFYLVYSATRNASEGTEAEAFTHARQVIGWEKALGLYFEETWQDWALHFTPLIVVMNYIYGSLHFVITAVVIVYLFRRHPDDYPVWRNTLAVATGLALVGFIVWPLMPPRLLDASYGYVDSLARYPTIWSFNSGTIQDLSNQYAAMPSLHFAWSAFSTLALAPRVTRPWMRWALWAYPVVTLLSIVLTANHYWLDAAAGAAALGIAYAVAHRFTRAGRREPVPA